MSDLKPCPFCGCDEIYKSHFFHPKCSSCGAVQDSVKGVVALEKWNERAIDKQLAKQQEEIAEYKAFMLGLELSSEDEERMLRMFDKYKGE